VLSFSQRHHWRRVSPYTPSRTCQSQKRSTICFPTTCGARQLHQNHRSRGVLTDNTAPCKTALRLSYHTTDRCTSRLALLRHSEKLSRTLSARSDIQSCQKNFCPFSISITVLFLRTSAKHALLLSSAFLYQSTTVVIPYRTAQQPNSIK